MCSVKGRVLHGSEKLDEHKLAQQVLVHRLNACIASTPGHDMPFNYYQKTVSTSGKLRISSWIDFAMTLPDDYRTVLHALQCIFRRDPSVGVNVENGLHFIMDWRLRYGKGSFDFSRNNVGSVPVSSFWCHESIGGRSDWGCQQVTIRCRWTGAPAEKAAQ